MRYTTIIDVSEDPALYRNHNAVLVYLHLVLKAGYHDDDRDRVELSIRRLAHGAGVTVSAVRHALSILQSAGLVRKEGDAWFVTKYVMAQEIHKRARTKREQEEQILRLERANQALQDDMARQRQQDVQQQLEDAARAQGKTPYMLMYEQWEESARNGSQTAEWRVRTGRARYEEDAKKMKEGKT